MNKKLIKEIVEFREKRNWKKFHTGENLAKSIVIEAGELLEVFQWSHNEKSIKKIEEELADVLMYSVLLAEEYKLDIEEIIRKKLKINNDKYPIEKSFGSAKKYDEFE